MPFFYYRSIGYLIAFILSILLTIILFQTLMRNSKITFLKVFGTFMVMFFISALVCYFVMFNLQINIAAPYIEEAINRQCGLTGFNIMDGEFDTDSRFSWSDVNKEIECRFRNSQWDCNC
jgi:phosphoglycerol transferase MdoB-like AlkP superfamily enzyme